LWVVGGEVSLNLEGLTQRLPELGDKQGAIVGYNVVWESMLGEYVLKEEFGKFWGIVGGAAGNENGLLSQAADDD
ncbi:hypothetical protein C0993_012472, partial [Termitomyces sp. T159_Od127]